MHGDFCLVFTTSAKSANIVTDAYGYQIFELLTPTDRIIDINHTNLFIDINWEV